MIEVGTTKQLLADDELIESMVHVCQVLNPGRKHPGNPLLVTGQPWEESQFGLNPLAVVSCQVAPASEDT